jgi:hypothetical protein
MTTVFFIVVRLQTLGRQSADQMINAVETIVGDQGLTSIDVLLDESWREKKKSSNLSQIM